MSETENTSQLRWDGVSKGSTPGNRIFIFLISSFGLLPAYLLLIPVCIYYSLFHREYTTPIRIFRTQLGLKTTFLDLYKHFHSFGQAMIDRFGFLYGKIKNLEYSQEYDTKIIEALGKNRGIIILSAHLGNWELGANLLSDRIKSPVNVVMLENERKEMTELFEQAFKKRKIRIIPVTSDGLDSVVEIVSALKRNEIVCFHGDRIIDQRSELIPFIGRDAKFPVGPFAIAASTGAQIIPVFVIKNEFKSYIPIINESISLGNVPRHYRNQAIREAMKKFVGILEDFIKNHPYEWYNYYDFWNTDN